MNHPGRARTAVLVAVVLAATACGSGGGDANEATSTPSGPADLSPRVGGIDAMRRYLSAEGIDGKRGDLTDPIDCAQVPESGAEQEYCVIDGASIYAEGLIILYLARVESRDKDNRELFKDVWEVRLAPGETAWSVTEVKDVPRP